MPSPRENNCSEPEEVAETLSIASALPRQCYLDTALRPSNRIDAPRAVDELERD